MDMQVMDREVRKLQSAKVKLMREPQFALFSGIMMLGKTQVVDDLPTAATNGRDEFYGRDFINSCDEKELRFTVLHENGHKAMRHLTTYEKLYEEDHKLANMACDYVINLMLVNMDPQESFISPPRRDGKIYVCLDRRFAKMSAKQVFDILKQEKKQKKQKENKPDEGGEGDDAGDGDPSDSGGFDSHDWDGARDMPDEVKKELEGDIKRALRQGQYAAKRAGFGSSAADALVGELLAPKIDWRAEMHDFVKSICAGRDTLTMRRHNRRYVWQDMFLPSLVSERVESIVVGADMSGSCVPYLTPVLSEVQGIAEDVRPEKLHLLYWDTSVVSHEVYDEANMASLGQSTRPKGGGGTSPSCVTQYMKDKNIKPDCVIMLTDGEVGNDWGGDWGVPVLWVIVHRKDIFAPFGKTIHIEE